MRHQQERPRRTLGGAMMEDLHGHPRLGIRVMLAARLRRLPDSERVEPPRRLRSNSIDGIEELRVRI